MRARRSARVTGLTIAVIPTATRHEGSIEDGKCDGQWGFATYRRGGEIRRRSTKVRDSHWSIQNVTIDTPQRRPSPGLGVIAGVLAQALVVAPGTGRNATANIPDTCIRIVRPFSSWQVPAGRPDGIRDIRDGLEIGQAAGAQCAAIHPRQISKVVHMGYPAINKVFGRIPTGRVAAVNFQIVVNHRAAHVCIGQAQNSQLRRGRESLVTAFGI